MPYQSAEIVLETAFHHKMLNLSKYLGVHGGLKGAFWQCHYMVVVAQSLTPVQLFATTMDCSMPGFPVPVPCPQVCSDSCLLNQWFLIISFSAPPPSAFNLSQHQGLFSSVSSSHQVAKVQWIYSGLISFWTDCFDLHTMQGTLKRLLQQDSLKESILRCSAFFMVQLSHPYMTTRKTLALTIWTFASKVMSLLFNTIQFWRTASSQLLFSILIGNTIFSIAQKAQWVLGNTGLANMLVWLWENEHFGQPNT